MWFDGRWPITHTACARVQSHSQTKHLIFLCQWGPCFYLLFYLFIFLYLHASAGSWLVHHELLHVHLLGSVLRLPGCLPGQGVRTLCLWIWDPWGEEHGALTQPTKLMSLAVALRDEVSKLPLQCLHVCPVSLGWIRACVRSLQTSPVLFLSFSDLAAQEMESL